MEGAARRLCRSYQEAATGDHATSLPDLQPVTRLLGSLRRILGLKSQSAAAGMPGMAVSDVACQRTDS